MPLLRRLTRVRRGPTRLAAWLATIIANAAAAQVAQVAPEAGIELQTSPTLQPAPRGEAGKKLPIILRADRVSGRPDLDATAEGDAELRRGGMVIRADSLGYQQADDLAHARGHVRVIQNGNLYTGPELQLHVERFEGYFLSPTYFFGQTGAGGKAQRIDFLDDQRAIATQATYTSCAADGSDDPAWLLTAGRVSLDLGTNEGVAENGVLRFYGVPILGAPRLSFPLTDERKSGWLPPTVGYDNKSGFQASIPYYWNIAPNRDATLSPSLSTERGPGLETQFRYLEPDYRGNFDLNLLPHDTLTGTERYALTAQHESDLPQGALLRFKAVRVSDDDYWKDFPRSVNNLAPRLLSSTLQLSKPIGDWLTYANIQSWQVLQTADPTTRIDAPYERMPQIGARYSGLTGTGLRLGFETEFNRFANPSDWTGDPSQATQIGPRPTGSRVHALGSVSWAVARPGWTLTPKLSFNAAAYSLDEAVGTVRANSSRLIPTLSVDSAWVLERTATWFGKSVRQTLEPRVLYVNTPYHDQSMLPNFDSALKDFNFESYFTENSLTGVDRVSDSHQFTAGVTTRFIDPDTGAESLRLGLAQRYLLRDQRVTLKADGTADEPLTQRLSDLLLMASTTLVPAWNLDASVQYSPDNSRTIRSIVGARYAPGPFRTVSATYRLTRGLSEQLELGWQWPLYGPTPEPRGAGTPATGSVAAGTKCGGSWYSVGRINYSAPDRRITDSILGFEYDAGCWIGRVVAERLSTGLSEATTRVLVQLEFVGLSRLGSNPLQVLKDNIPGYRLLRDDRTSVQPNTPLYDD